jgi:hypothetical protein
MREKSKNIQERRKGREEGRYGVRKIIKRE